MKRYFQPIIAESSTTSSGQTDSRKPLEDGPDHKRLKMNKESPDSDGQTLFNLETGLSSEYLRLKTYSMISPDDQVFASSISLDEWHETDDILVKLRTIKDRSYGDFLGIILFDLDGTIITTKSGKKFPVDHNDWKFLYENTIVNRLRQLYNEEKKLIVFVSNQSGLLKKSNGDSIKLFQNKVDSIVEKIGIPIDFICALKSGSVYRKPCTGMLDFLSIARHWSTFEYYSVQSIGSESSQADCSDNSASTNYIPNYSKKMVYVGDAAGRPESTGRKKDFSDSDLKLAINAHLQFMTPEHFFLNSAQRLHSQVLQNALGSVRLSNYLKNSDANLAALTRLLSAGSKSKQKIVLMIGSPASGKSTFSKGFLHHIRNTEVASDSPCAGEWLRVNQDELSTLPKCIQAARRHLSSGSDIPRHVIVDNTNINKSTREQWVQLAHELDCEIYGVVLNVKKELCFALHDLRLLDPCTPEEDQRKIPDMVIHKAFKDLPQSMPTEKDGFTAIEIIEDFSPLIPELSDQARLHDWRQQARSKLLHSFIV